MATTKKTWAKNASSKGDSTLREFETKDLGADIKASGLRLRRRKTVPTSILLEPDLVAALKETGAKRGLGYQTMLKMIVREHIDDYR